MPSSRFGEAKRAEGKACSPSQRWRGFQNKATVTSDFKLEAGDFGFAVPARIWSLSESGVKKRAGFSGGDWLSGPTVIAMSGTVIFRASGVRRSASLGAKSRGLEEGSAPNRYSRPGKRPQVLTAPDVPSPT